MKTTVFPNKLIGLHVLFISTIVTAGPIITSSNCCKLFLIIDKTLGQTVVDYIGLLCECFIGLYLHTYLPLLARLMI